MYICFLDIMQNLPVYLMYYCFMIVHRTLLNFYVTTLKKDIKERLRKVNVYFYTMAIIITVS